MVKFLFDKQNIEVSFLLIFKLNNFTKKKVLYIFFKKKLLAKAC